MLNRVTKFSLLATMLAGTLAGCDLPEDELSGDELGTTSYAAQAEPAPPEDVKIAEFDSEGRWLSKSRSTDDRVASAVAIDSDGTAVIGGTVTRTTTVGGVTTKKKLWVLSRNALDPINGGPFMNLGFGFPLTPEDRGSRIYENIEGTMTALMIDASGRIVAIGTNGKKILVARFNAVGIPDVAFNTAAGYRSISVPGFTNAEGLTINKWRDGYVIGGHAYNLPPPGSTAPTVHHSVVLKLNKDGALVTGFDGDGIAVADPSGSSLDGSGVRGVWVTQAASEANDKVTAAGQAIDFENNVVVNRGVSTMTFSNAGALTSKKVYTREGHLFTPMDFFRDAGGVIYFAGQGQMGTEKYAFASRIAANGAWDEDFYGIGFFRFDGPLDASGNPLTTASEARGLSFDRLNRLVIVGRSTGGTKPTSWALRIGAGNGELDPAFGIEGVQYGIQPNSTSTQLLDVASLKGTNYIVGTAKNEALAVHLPDAPNLTAFQADMPTNVAPSRANAYLLARLSLAAYHNATNTDAGDIARPGVLASLGIAGPEGTTPGYSWQIIDQANGQQVRTPVLVVKTPTAVIVTVMGTREGENIVTDLQFVQSPYNGGQVHSGFLGAMQAVLPQVRMAVAANGGLAGRKLWFAGHSLGGAVAILLAHEFHKPSVISPSSTNPIPVTGVMTYGQPRVGDPAWSDSYSPILGHRTHRFHRNHDPVPRVPFNGPIQTYEHVGKLHFVHYDVTDEEIPLPTRNTPAIYFNANTHTYETVSLTQHAIVRYFRNIVQFQPTNAPF